jgi:DNA mismatch endonuclease (patch repair protein)
MQRQARADTHPELALRQELHRRGLRYRLHRQVLPGLRRNLDIVFTSARVAVEVRGCFWHRCPLHQSAPKSNAEWWAGKLARNVERDRETALRLAEAGWLLVEVWEHEDPSEAARRVEAAVRIRRPKP